MPAIPPDQIENAQASLQRMKVFTFDRLLSLLDCSIRCGRSKLKQWGAHTSYNKNGRYYAMPSIPRFDENGLWSCTGIRFSECGTLKKTVVHLVLTSKAGLTGKEIGEIVGLSQRSFLHHFREEPGMRREKQGGVYVYFSNETDRYERQKETRLEVFASSARAFGDAEAVVILAAVIKHHEIRAEDIPTLPEVTRAGLHPGAVRDFLERHDLLKKTADTRP